jgi:UMF1 family MFS transporter
VHRGNGGAVPRSAWSSQTALALFVLANVAFELADVFYNAFLPELVPQSRIGRVSGLGWGMGYIGGLLALAVALVTLVQPETPWFGFVHADGESIRATNLLVAAWFGIFSVPLLLFVPERRPKSRPPQHVVRDALAQLRRTFGEIRKYRQVARFLLARLVYNDALVTIFAFGGIYAAETFEFSLPEVLQFGIVVNIAAGLGAFAMGYLDDYIGGKRTIVVSLLGLILATALAIAASTKTSLWIAGVAIGIFAGPNQSASRSLMGRFVPRRAENEFFGFFAFSGKLTAFIGPFLLGVLTDSAARSGSASRRCSRCSSSVCR